MYYRFIKITNNNNTKEFLIDITTMKDIRIRISILNRKYALYYYDNASYHPVFSILQCDCFSYYCKGWYGDFYFSKPCKTDCTSSQKTSVGVLERPGSLSNSHVDPRTDRKRFHRFERKRTQTTHRLTFTHANALTHPRAQRQHQAARVPFPHVPGPHPAGPPGAQCAHPWRPAPQRATVARLPRAG